MGRIRTHVGDQTDAAFIAHGQTFIELLGNRHRPAGGKMELPPGFLLEGAGNERRRRRAGDFFGGDFVNAVIGFLQVLLSAFRIRLHYGCLFWCHRSTRPEPREKPAFLLVSACLINSASMLQYSTGTKPWISLSRSTTILTATDWTLPAERPLLTFRQSRGTDFITHQPVQHPAGLLGIDQLHIDLARVFESRFDGFVGYFMEDHPAVGYFWSDGRQLPAQGARKWPLLPYPDRLPDRPRRHL